MKRWNHPQYLSVPDEHHQALVFCRDLRWLAWQKDAMPKLTSAQIKTALATTPDWKRKGKAIQRTFEFKDFVAAMKFVNAVARAAEKANHHPDIDIRWNEVKLVLSTHDAGGLTKRDFDLAQKADALAGEGNGK